MDPFSDGNIRLAETSRCAVNQVPGRWLWGILMMRCGVMVG